MGEYSSSAKAAKPAIMILLTLAVAVTGGIGIAIGYFLS